MKLKNQKSPKPIIRSKRGIWDIWSLRHQGQRGRRLHSLLQLINFERAKCPYFLDLWHRSWDMSLFSLQGILNLDVLCFKICYDMIWPYLSSLAINQKKSAPSFVINGPGAERWTFSFSEASLASTSNLDLKLFEFWGAWGYAYFASKICENLLMQ